jgi:hypothetical protein
MSYCLKKSNNVCLTNEGTIHQQCRSSRGYPNSLLQVYSQRLDLVYFIPPGEGTPNDRLSREVTLKLFANLKGDQTGMNSLHGDTGYTRGRKRIYLECSKIHGHRQAM